MNTITIKISPGEFFDRMSILEIKANRLFTPEKLARVYAAIGVLQEAGEGIVIPPTLLGVVENLKTINERIWCAEDSIRRCEKERDFSLRFVELARLIYKLNDRRAALKLCIDDHFASSLADVKSHALPTEDVP